MSRWLVLLGFLLSATGCGFGYGGIYGPKNYPAGSISTFTADDPFCRYSCSGTRTTSYYDAFTSRGGLLVGYRRGWSWASFGDRKIESGSSFDGHLTGYYSLFSLGVGYTSEGGTIEGDEVGYKGFFVEPGIGVALGPVYLAGTLAVISGTTHYKIDGNLSTQEADVTGFRPGGRVAIGVYTIAPVTFKVVADLRYLITPDVMLGAAPASFGGWSTVFGIMATM